MNRTMGSVLPCRWDVACRGRTARVRLGENVNRDVGLPIRGSFNVPSGHQARIAYPHLLSPQQSQTAQFASRRMGRPHSSQVSRNGRRGTDVIGYRVRLSSPFSRWESRCQRQACPKLVLCCVGFSEMTSGYGPNEPQFRKSRILHNLWKRQHNTLETQFQIVMLIMMIMMRMIPSCILVARK